jgi:hypothetical protein
VDLETARPGRQLWRATRKNASGVRTQDAVISIGAGNVGSDEMWVRAGKIENRLAVKKKSANRRKEAVGEDREVRRHRGNREGSRFAWPLAARLSCV